MIQVISIPAPIYPRKAYSFDNEEEKQRYTNFKVGVRVLPSEYFNNETPGVEFYYKSSHSPYEPGHLGTGGIVTQCSDGSTRVFYPDSIIIHPSSFEMRNDVTKIEYDGVSLKKRGRKPKGEKVEKDPNAPKGKRGRKPDLEKQAERLRIQQAREQRKANGEVLKRGRPKMDEALRKSKPYIPSSEPKRRGRVANPQLQEQREQEKQRMIDCKIALGIKLGKGRINDADRKRIQQWLKNN